MAEGTGLDNIAALFAADVEKIETVLLSQVADGYDIYPLLLRSSLRQEAMLAQILEAVKAAPPAPAKTTRRRSTPKKTEG